MTQKPPDDVFILVFLERKYNTSLIKNSLKCNNLVVTVYFKTCFHKENLFILQYDFFYFIYPHGIKEDAAFTLHLAHFAGKAPKYI